MLVIGSVSYSSDSLHRTRWELDKNLKAGIENTGEIHLSDGLLDSEDYKNVLCDIRDLDTIQNVYSFGTQMGNILPQEDIIKIQQEKFDTWKNEEYVQAGYPSNGVVYTLISTGGTEACHLQFKKGGIIPEEEREEGWDYIYLGSDYDELEVGKEYFSSDGKSKVKIAGILKGNQTWLSENMLSIQTDLVENTVNTDCMVFYEVHSGSDANRWFFHQIFTKEKDAEMQDAIKEVSDILSAYGINGNVVSLNDMISETEEQFERVFTYMEQLLIITFLSVIVIQTSVCIADLLERKKYYGILYANGATNTDLLKIMFFQGMMNFMVSCGFTLFIGVVLVNGEGLNRELFYHATIWKAGLYGIAVTVLSVFVPMLYVGRQKPAELIHG